MANPGPVEERSFGRLIYDHKMSIGAVSMMMVAAFALVVPRPQTPEELLGWLGCGVGILSLAASAARLRGHGEVRWPGTEHEIDSDEEWARRARHNRDAELAVRSSWDFLGKFLALDAAIFALVTAGVHLLLLQVA